MLEQRDNPFQRFHDRLFIIFLFFAGLAGLAISLSTMGFYLQWASNTLLLSTVLFIILSSNWLRRSPGFDKQIQLASLALIPIVLRFAIVSSFFASFQEVSIRDIFFISGIWAIVSVAEECFRATMFNFYDFIVAETRIRPGKEQNIMLKFLFGTASWLVFHYFQRPFTLDYYALWLFLTGIILSFILEKGGLGSAVLAHFLIDITA
mgnify:CR=1 FL=1